MRRGGPKPLFGGARRTVQLEQEHWRQLFMVGVDNVVSTRRPPFLWFLFFNRRPGMETLIFNFAAASVSDKVPCMQAPPGADDRDIRPLTAPTV